MIERFLILDHEPPSPNSEPLIFCDGAGGDAFRPEQDLDLSHWRPNRTPRQYRAGTSTEICFHFLDAPLPGPWTLAVNNHLDIDGLLSVYALVHSKHAQENRTAIIQAAEMGDFWGWGEASAQRLFQGLTQLMNAGRSAGQPLQAIYDEAFRRVPALLDGSDPDVDSLERSLEPLRQGVQSIAVGAISRRPISERLTHYLIPQSVVGDRWDQINYVPKFNEIISPRALLWPQARAKWDEQRLCLVSALSRDGWRHDLWFPGYLWADTENRWVIPGLNYRDGMESYDVAMPRFGQAIEHLNQLEQRCACWATGAAESKFSATIQGQFPLAARTLDAAGVPVASSLEPDLVAATLGKVFPDS
ncbi:MAG: DUF6687 family protein [Singulisphaera sp.]